MNRSMALAAVLVAVFAGCSGKQTTYPVQGVVRFPDGKPLPGGSIYFSEPDLKVSARGTIGSDGSFQLSTFEAGDGAPAGTYRVVVKPPGPADSADKRERIIDARYESDATTDLQVTVKEESNRIEIEVQPPRRKGRPGR